MWFKKQSFLLCAFISIASAAIGLGRSDVCLERPIIGSCRAALLSYYYNADSGTCDCFLFGGCNAGVNNFHSVQDCMNTCGVSIAQQSTAVDCRHRPGATRPSPLLPGATQAQVDKLEQIFTETTNEHLSNLDNTPQHKLPPPPPTPVQPAPRPPVRPQDLFPLVTVVQTTTQRPVPTTPSRPIPTTRRPIPTTRRPIPTTRRPILTTRRPIPTTRRPIPTTRRPVWPPAAAGVTPRRPFSEIRSDFQDRVINSQKLKLQDIIRQQRERDNRAQLLQQQQLRDQERQQQQLFDSLEAIIAGRG